MSKKLLITSALLVLSVLVFIAFQPIGITNNIGSTKGTFASAEKVSMDKQITEADFTAVNLLDKVNDTYRLDQLEVIDGTLAYVFRKIKGQEHVLFYNDREIERTDGYLEVVDSIPEKLVYRKGSSSVVRDGRSFPITGTLHDINLIDGVLSMRTSQASYMDDILLEEVEGEKGEQPKVFIGRNGDGKDCFSKPISAIVTTIYCGAEQVGRNYSIAGSDGSQGLTPMMYEGEPLYIANNYNHSTIPTDSDESFFEFYADFNSLNYDWFVVHREEKVSKDYERVTGLSVFDDSYYFRAFKNDKWLLVINGKEVGQQYDKIGETIISNGHFIFKGYKTDRNEDIVGMDIVVDGEVVASFGADYPVVRDNILIVDGNLVYWDTRDGYIQYGDSTLFEGKKFGGLYDLNGRLVVVSDGVMYLENLAN